VLYPEAGGRNHDFTPWRERVTVSDREERDTVELNPLHARIGIEQQIECQMACLVREQADGCPGDEKRSGLDAAILRVALRRSGWR
jgi:hypothetical protein